MKENEREKLRPLLFEALLNLQRHDYGWVGTDKLEQELRKVGLRYQEYGAETLRAFLEFFPEDLAITDSAVTQAGEPERSYVILRQYRQLRRQKRRQDGKVPDEKKPALAKLLRDILQNLSLEQGEWIYITQVGNAVAAAGINYKEYGFIQLNPFLQQFAEQIELQSPDPSGTKAEAVVRLRRFEMSVPRRAESTAACESEPESPKFALDDCERERLEKEILKRAQQISVEENRWRAARSFLEFLRQTGVDYKKYGTGDGILFLKQFPSLLDVRMKASADGKKLYPVVRLHREERASGQTPRKTEAERIPEDRRASEAPEAAALRDARPFAKASNERLQRLMKLLRPERWSYGETALPVSVTAPILGRYMENHISRICAEHKFRYCRETLPGYQDVQYGICHTGLVTADFRPIYAFFKNNLLKTGPRWNLDSFAAVGTQAFEDVFRHFEALPPAAAYELPEIQALSDGAALYCDYRRILTEQTERLPLEFLQSVCTREMLTSGDSTAEEVYTLHPDNAARNRYFANLGRRIEEAPEVSEAMKQAFGQIVNRSLREFRWNRSVALPGYDAARNVCDILLPLRFAEGREPERAIAVERTEAGEYIAREVLSLSSAYRRCRAVLYPDSQWLAAEKAVAYDLG